MGEIISLIGRLHGGEEMSCGEWVYSYDPKMCQYIMRNGDLVSTFKVGDSEYPTMINEILYYYRHK